MNIATINDFDKVWGIFQDNKEWFPHVRKSHIRNRLNWKQVVLENDVVITFQKYKRKGKIGHNSDVITNIGDVILHQIVKDKNGNARKTIEDFFKFVNTNVYLTVRENNVIANKFYEKVGMEKVGTISWAKGTMPGLVWKKT